MPFFYKKQEKKAIFMRKNTIFAENSAALGNLKINFHTLVCRIFATENQ